MGRGDPPMTEEMVREIEEERKRRTAPQEPLTPEELAIFREIKKALEEGGAFRGNIWTKDQTDGTYYFEVLVQCGDGMKRFRSQRSYYDLTIFPWDSS
mgnify:CR=1 FL=1